MSSNRDGFQNETELANYINDTEYYNDMNSNMKQFLSFIFGETDINNRKIIATKPTGYARNIKPDIIISTDNIKKYISIKKGSGNSVHQESINDFTKFLSDIRIPNNIVQYLLEFHYGDGTTDGSGKQRISSINFKNLYPDKIQQINAEMNKPEILELLFNRFLFVGNAINAPRVDVVYHGTVENGLWASTNEITNHLLHNTFNRNNVSFSHLNYQVWNRCLNFNPKTEDRRQIMQIKWASLETDFIEIKQKRIRNEH